MKKGSSLPLVMVVVAFLLISLGFWFYYSPKDSSNVKGAKISGVDKGFFVTVNSEGSTWDLQGYLCKDKNACLASPDAGFRLEGVSGGKTKNYQASFPYQDSWSEYSYVKMYVKSGWGSQEKAFNIVTLGDVAGSSIEEISSSGRVYKVGIIPVEKIKEAFYQSFEFSDK